MVSSRVPWLARKGVFLPCLYRRLLGPAFDSLPATLRDFHEVDRTCHFVSTFRITRGKGICRNLLCWIAGLPPGGEAVPMRLRVYPEGDYEHWERSFGEHRLSSVQSLQDGLMVESFGNGWRFGFRLHIERAALRLELARAWFCGVRWPLRLSPHGDGIERGQEDGCSIVVRAGAPLLGMLVQYEGLVTPVEGRDPQENDCDGRRQDAIIG